MEKFLRMSCWATIYGGIIIPLTVLGKSIMIEFMSRTRMIIDTEEEVRLAVKLAATKAGQGISEFVNSLLKKELPEEIKDAKKYVHQIKEKTHKSK